MRPRSRDRRLENAQEAAGNGLLDRRVFMKGGLGALATGAFMAFASTEAGAAGPPEIPAGMKIAGAPLSPYGSPATYEREVTRTLIRSQPGTTGAGASRTPLEALEGIITPSGLHFERHHNGVPAIDPAQHQLLIHGMVARPLVFTVASLLRYPMVSRIHFLECSGNSGAMYQPTPPALTCGQTHGLVSCSEWTGVPLRLLLAEAGVDPRADWILAEGADAAAMSRSVPMRKAMDDAMLALYQNGERLRPENGYPVRLFLPGYEGNMSVKWLRRIKVTDTPTMTKDETSRYTDLQGDGKSLMFTYPMEVKSLITRPAPGLRLTGPGLYELSGIAWSGHGKIRKVEVSADGGQSWAEAALSPPVLAHALTRFRIAWKWNGAPTVLKSRATDDAGHVQPTRDRLIAEHGANVIFHYNAIQAWGIESSGEVKNVYA
ncbi:MAG: sulfite dehydrogenase [Candidatus Rokuibacteriota bacterium]|nr:MAG: sulfite dehydrogenase [Candidatus Rokubacteria bacterium]